MYASLEASKHRRLLFGVGWHALRAGGHEGLIHELLEEDMASLRDAVVNGDNRDHRFLEEGLDTQSARIVDQLREDDVDLLVARGCCLPAGMTVVKVSWSSGRRVLHVLSSA